MQGWGIWVLQTIIPIIPNHELCWLGNCCLVRGFHCGVWMTRVYVEQTVPVSPWHSTASLHVICIATILKGSFSVRGVKSQSAQCRSQRSGVWFPIVPPTSTASLYGLGQAAESQGAPRRKEWQSIPEYSLPGNPWKVGIDMKTHYYYLEDLCT